MFSAQVPGCQCHGLLDNSSSQETHDLLQWPLRLCAKMREVVDITVHQEGIEAMSHPPFPPRNYSALWGVCVCYEQGCPWGQFTMGLSESSCLEIAFLPGCVRSCWSTQGGH